MMTVYRRIEIVNGESAEPVAWVAVHPVNWPGHIGEPDAAFIEDEAAERRLAAAERLAEATDSLLGTLQNLADIPSLAADLLVFAEYAEARAALAEWQAANGGEHAG
jgi:hypothetical protein